METCTETECERPADGGHGCCRTHYAARRRRGEIKVGKAVVSHCSEDGCDLPHYARRLCNIHYQRRMASGIEMPPKITAGERFWMDVDRRDSDDCWPWKAVRTEEGYGRFRLKGKRIPAHRFAYELLVGPISDGLTIDHICRNPPCVNPDHLEPVTAQENNLRSLSPSAVNARKTHCLRGHAFDEKNTGRDARGDRFCRKCKAIVQRGVRARKKATRNQATA